MTLAFVIIVTNDSYHFSRHTFQFDNILNNKEISDSVNSILNENHSLISKEINASVEKVLADQFKKWFVAAFSKYPYSSFFLDP